jgi:GAF domain-containing protein
MAHLFCEIWFRLKSVGLAHDNAFSLPATQADLGDALGLSLVHVNRTIQRLRADGLISVNRDRVVRLLDWPRLTEIAEFDPTYLRKSPIPRAYRSPAAKLIELPSDAGAAGNDVSLAGLLKALVYTVIEQTGGKARAAFYLADDEGKTLRHLTGMPPAYARCVDGFEISSQSLACGLAAATRNPVITPDVAAEPRWKQWLWLAKSFDYRACWSFPVETPGGKIVGILAMYFEEPTEPKQSDLELASALTRTAATIISKH